MTDNDTVLLWRYRLTAAAIVLALAGAGLVIYPFATDLWAARIQSGLSGSIRDGAAEYRKGRLENGDPLTRLQIPSLDVDVIVVEGITESALRAGAGHYPQTALPGRRGNVAIAGHRTTFGRPFNRLDELDRGDRILLTTPIGRHVYEVAVEPWVVTPYDWRVINDYPRGGSFLTLTTCHPEGSDDYRIVVRAVLIASSSKESTG